MTYEDLGGRAAPPSLSLRPGARAPPATKKQVRSAARAPRRQTVLRARKEGETARPTQQARSNLDRFYTGFGTVPATFSTPLLTEVRLLE